MWKLRSNNLVTEKGQVLKITGLSPVDWRNEVRDLKKSYRVVRIPKRRSGYRTLTVPCTVLMEKQRRLLQALSQALKSPQFVTGGVPRGSIRSHASPHVGQLWVATFDVCDFFGQVRPAMIEAALLSLGLPAHVIEQVIMLSFVGESLPQGAPTSPFLANLAFLPVDRLLRRMAKKRGLAYTRYLDDLAFSGKSDFRELRGPIKQTCARFGFPLHEEKEQFMKAGTRQVITGLVVNKKLRPTPEFYRRLREDMKDWETAANISREQVLGGRLSFLKQFEPELVTQLKEKLQTSSP